MHKLLCRYKSCWQMQYDFAHINLVFCLHNWCSELKCPIEFTGELERRVGDWKTQSWFLIFEKILLKKHVYEFINLENLIKPNKENDI